MVKVGSAIQVLFPKILHVTCLSHTLYRKTKQIHGDISLVDKLISSKVFLKRPAKIQLFKNEIPEIKLSLGQSLHLGNVVKHSYLLL